MIRHTFDYQSMNDTRVLINQRVQDLLSATRVYLDHAAHHFGNLEGAIPGLRAEFDRLRAKHHDESDGYRIAEAGRCSLSACKREPRLVTDASVPAKV